MLRFVLATLFLSSPALDAQSITGSMVGTVLDPSGLAVSGADVQLLQVATGAERRAATNVDGRFFFGSLQPGEYRLTVEMQGFKQLEQRSINLSAAETLALGEMRLEVGAVTESVSVTAAGIRVQTETAERAGVLTGNQVETLAIKGRNVMSLLSLLPGVVDQNEPDELVNNWNINVQGNRNNTNNVSLDGATLNAVGNQFNSVVNVSMDAVAEVKVLLSNYQAEYGRLSGANVHIVSKSGTRQFHGLGSYWKRHEQFNANNFFNNFLGLPKPRYRYNTWNYNIGGPVYIPGKFNTSREKLFFFWSQEFWPLTTATAVQRRTVPSELERAGNFSQSLDQNNLPIVVRDPYNNRTPFPGNAIPASRVDPNGQALLRFFPTPNFLDRTVSRGAYNYVFQSENDTPKRTETLKLDYHASSNDIVTFNWTHRRDEQNGPLQSGTNFEHLNLKNLNDGFAYIGRYQKILNPTLINELNVSFSDRPWNHFIEESELRRNQRDQAGFRLSQFNPSINPFNLLPNATFGGIPSAASINYEGRTPLTTTHKIFTFSNNLSKTFTKHNVKAGFYADRIWADNQTAIPFNGTFAFARNVNNPLETDYAYANAALGVFNSYVEASARPYPRAYVSNIEFFAQDNWKLHRRLTLDLGLRFYYLPQSFVGSNELAGFLPTAFNGAQAVQLIQPARVGNQRVGRHPVTGQTYPVNFIGAMAPGVGDSANGMITPLTDKSVPRSLMATPGLMPAPRIGFAYDVFGNGKTAVRGGFGMFYNRMAQGQVLYPYTTQPPVVQTPNIFFGTIAGLLGSSGVLFPSNVQGLDPGNTVPRVMNYSLNVQQDIGFGTVVDVGYVGSLGRNLLWQRNINYVPLGANFRPENIDPTTNTALPPSFLRPYMGYNNINISEPASSSNYHSLQVTANRRFARALEFGASWTWSKSMDFNSADGGAVSIQVPIREWNYGLSNYDRTHVLKINWLYDAPKTPFTHPVLKGVFNDWQMSGIASFVSGAPLGIGYSTVQPVDITGSATDGARIVVLGDPVLPKSERTFYRNFRTEMFALPAVGTLGNAARTLIRGPGINNWDLAFYKSFPVREKMRFQLRWELYNAFNHTQFSGLDTGARFDARGAQVNTQFGQFTAARNPRFMQFALRFSF